MDGGLRCFTMYFATVAWDTSMPSFSNSPWIRGAPHVAFAVHIFRIRFRIAWVVSGLPGRRRQLFHVQ
jgi:hypothetical protein